jgi:hypothetical protein
MENAANMTIIALVLGIFVLLAVCAGVIALQIFLSKAESRWPGLILPAISLFISLLYSLLFVSSVAIFTDGTRTTGTGTADMNTLSGGGASSVIVSDGASSVEARVSEGGGETDGVVDGGGGETSNANAGGGREARPAAGLTSSNLVPLLLLFLSFNIPTVVLFAIYAMCRRMRGKRRALDKMSLQDLD